MKYRLPEIECFPLRKRGTEGNLKTPMTINRKNTQAKVKTPRTLFNWQYNRSVISLNTPLFFKERRKTKKVICIYNKLELNLLVLALPRCCNAIRGNVKLFIV